MTITPIPLPMPSLPAQFQGRDWSIPRTDWTRHDVETLFDMPFIDLVSLAQSIHRSWFDPNTIQRSTLVNIKTGACPEDCKYCSQSRTAKAKLKVEPLMGVEEVRTAARKARENGATRLCMGAAWRQLRERDLPTIVEMIGAVKEEGLQTCMTLGMLKPELANALAEAGLDYYNHNVDTSPEYYKSIISSRTYENRLDTLKAVREAGIRVCSGGIVGLGESRADRAGMLHTLATLETHPNSVPINMLVGIKGTALSDEGKGGNVDPLEFVRTIAVARILMPRSVVRLSAGRHAMDDSTQALAFMAGANSIFYGEELLTTENSPTARDNDLLTRLGITPMAQNPND
ncbi:biotin synthase BioB [Haematospirillum jordaniae]|nr:biotin synthase BioB [Haematospirillum jordaniae]NKD59372.1 biotin synthase BioB [Haematospirillum jordaniae]NKD67065.1 biotin synthase BioB [Haematospirillum jordaniae]NKD79348.1 biotin synthase BioB [Haematospirillum jordaniae]NKD81645.1 biotin synthase BioB [Haematospirillum jordaniae]